MARLHSQHQRPLITWVSSLFSTTKTDSADPQPQHISRNWLASGVREKLGDVVHYQVNQGLRPFFAPLTRFRTERAVCYNFLRDHSL